LEVTKKLTFQTGKTDQIQTIYYFKTFKDENPKRTRNKILKRALSAKTHFFEKSHKINTFWETNSIENVWVTFHRRRVFKTFLAQLRDFWLEFILTQSRLKIRLDIAPKSRKSFFEKMDLDNFCLLWWENEQLLQTLTKSTKREDCTFPWKTRKRNYIEKHFLEKVKLLL